MKKLLFLFSIMSLVLGYGSITHASGCEELSFNDADLCIDIERETSTRFQMDVDVSNTNGTVSVLCDILLPNNQLKNVGACNGEFTYDGGDERTVKIYVRVNNEYKTLEAKYDFDDGEWTDRIDDNDDNSNGDLEEFEVRLSPSTPETDEWTDVTIEAVDDDGDTIEDYRGTVVITFQYKDGSSRRTLSSSKYDLRDLDLDSNDEYDFTSSDDGKLTFEVKFDDEDDYRIIVEDEDEDVSTTKTFSVDDDGSSSNSNGDVEEFEVTFSPSSPDEDEEIDVTIEAVDDDGDTVEDYTEKVKFTVQRKSGSSWVTASSSDYDLSQTTYTFTSSNDGKKTLSNLLTFTNDGEFRLKVTDDEDSSIVGYKEVDIDSDGGSSSNGDLEEFEIRLSPSTPETDEWTDVTIEAVDDDGDTIEDYRGTVVITFQYKDGSSRRTLSSSKYDLRDLDLDSNDEYDFTSSDDGELTFEVKFDDEDDYRIIVEDEDEDVSTTKTFSVDDDGSSNSNGDVEEFEVTFSPSSPDEDEEIDVTIEAVDDDGDTVEDYTEKVKFTVQKKSGSSWVTASSSAYSLSQSTYTFTSSNDGKKKITDLLSFDTDGTYRLKVTDNGDSSIIGYSKTVTIGSSSSNDNDDFSSAEIRQIRNLYNVRPSLIDELEDAYPRLRSSSRWQDEQEDLYDEMEKIIDGDDSDYQDYEDFFDAFMDWYTYTLTLR